ncbi:hypothetical protein DVH24_025530 [Malus domestica]|uniref:Uncharacterized protein n=1 Tax=Malus domestica TaxID=3750 RepID=A0A498HM57_MALDO|nr:hypothetical protein DVH24_025530 [Malus domestica]
MIHSKLLVLLSMVHTWRKLSRIRQTLREEHCGVCFEWEFVPQGKLLYILDGDNVRHGLNCDLVLKPKIVQRTFGGLVDQLGKEQRRAQGMREGRYENVVSEMIPLQSSVLTFVALRSVWMFHNIQGSSIPMCFITMKDPRFYYQRGCFITLKDPLFQCGCFIVQCVYMLSHLNVHKSKIAYLIDFIYLCILYLFIIVLNLFNLNVFYSSDYA